MRCQGERIALSPPPVRGLEFRKYVSIQRGMSEGELLASPALRTCRRATARGRVSDIERVRKF